MKTIIASNILNSYPYANLIIQELKVNQVDYQLEDDNNVLYFGFPKFTGYEEVSNEPDLILLSQNHGILAIRFCDDDEIDEERVEDLSEDLYGLLFGKLNESKLLRLKRRMLKLPLDTCVYTKSKKVESNELVCTSIEDIKSKLEFLKSDLDNQKLDLELIYEARSILEGTKALSDNSKINEKSEEDSYGFVVEQLNNEIMHFDFEQLQSAVTIIDGPQRIRGLAGSGKTVVLAMKTAQIHMSEPEKLILVTFHTKSLYQQLKNLITKFYRHYKRVDPDWTKIHIKHAWGGRGLDGVYYSACMDNGITPLNFNDGLKVNPDSPFSYLCSQANKSGKLREKYDFVLIDEAQDLPESFFQLVYYITKFNQNIEKEKNIIWGYDEFQNIFKVKTKTPKELFGVDQYGNDLVNLSESFKKIPGFLSNDIVLHKCYRNPRLILVVAHALGFGIYNQDGFVPVQILESKEHWEDFGYDFKSDEFKIGNEIVVERSEENSPLSINKFLDNESLIKYQSFDNLELEVEWVISEIIDFIQGGIKPENILVIGLDDRYAKVYFKHITSLLMEKEIYTNNVLLNPYTSTNFYKEDQITLSTVHRAKGNEASVVFVLGIDAMFKFRNTRNARNKIFTAFTRTKTWLRVSGLGKQSEYFFSEISTAIDTFPSLKFIQPSLEEVETIQRDLTDKHQKFKVLKEEMFEKMKKSGFSQEEINEQLSQLLIDYDK